MAILSSRFGTSTLHQRDARSALFESYTGDRNRNHSTSPAAVPGGVSGYGYQGGVGTGQQGGGGGFRAATPNSRYAPRNNLSEWGTPAKRRV